MKIAVVGLGYVGLPLAVEFGKKHTVVGFDINAKRIAELQSGQDHTREVEPEELKKASRLVAIDLKVGEFEAAHKGQMELYLRCLEKHEQMEGEATPIGLILCTGKNQEHVELLQLPQSNIHVADYLTQLPSREVLQAKLHQSIELARAKLNITDAT